MSSDRKVATLSVTSQKSEIVDTTSPTQRQNAKEEFLDQNESPGSIIFGVLNELGIIGSGVLGALYLLERKENAATESTLESVTAKLKEKEVAMTSLRENLEGKILEEKEKSLKQDKKTQEEQAFLSSELASARTAAMDLQKQLEIEKKLVQELEVQVPRLDTEITRVKKDNLTLEAELKEQQSRVRNIGDQVKMANANLQEKEKEIESLRFSLRKTEKESADFSAKSEQARKALLQAEAQIQELKQEMATAEKDLGLKKLSLKELSERLASSVAEREDTNEKLSMLHEELNQMKLSNDRDLASARQAIFAKQEEVKQLKEKLDIAFKEGKQNRRIIIGLQEENGSLKALLQDEKANVKHLNGELERSIESFETSRSKVATLSSELTASKQVQAQLEAEMTKLQKDKDAMCGALEERLHEEELSSSKLSNELDSVKKALDTSRNELLFLNKKLKDSMDSYENLKGKLSQVSKTAETTIAALNEEKKVVAALSRELEASERTLLEEKEDRRLLQRDFEEATKSVDDLRSCLMSLSEELEAAKSQINFLDTEKASLYESLKEQKRLSQEVQESAENAKSVLARTGKEKEAYLKRAKKLEVELSSAKGEILRLRKQITVMNTALEESQLQKENEIQRKQSYDNASSPADVSLQIENMQAELYQIQKKLGDADQVQIQSEVAANSFNDVVSQDKLSEDTVLVAPVSTHDMD
eukprot:Gb_07855 [translate_table: standard]